ncbi:MAG TPA: RNA polymerase sigma factor [Vicinamibacterales bacterium]|nr:RNA polymerase sigma factor [Vicinamibacterales bacterium]
MTSPTTGNAAALAALVERARGGDAEAVNALVVALQDDIYRLALRMTAHPEDAEDATQEVLIKVVTRLDSFRGEASVKTWAYRIAVRHVLDRQKSRVEALALDFEHFGADLLDGLAAEPEPDPILAEEVKRGCTLAMLTCLDRELRLAFLLTDVFDLPHAEAADLCGVAPDVYRQRVSRARRALEAFTRSYCGLVAADTPCRCDRRVARAEALGRLSRHNLTFVRLETDALSAATAEMEGLHDSVRLMRSHPPYLTPARVRERLRGIFAGLARRHDAAEA